MKKYNIIYADPPWQYKNYNYAETLLGDRAKRGIVKEYPVMSIENIKTLPVHFISSDDCILFIWVTFPLLKEGLDTIRAWGFEYKTIGFNWIKTNTKSQTPFWGMGNWTRSNSEICLIGIKGNPKRTSASVHQVIDYPETLEYHIGKHSKKPEVVRDAIVKLCGDLPRIELFSRDKTDGWDVFGNEVEGSIDLLGVADVDQTEDM